MEFKRWFEKTVSEEVEKDRHYWEEFFLAAFRLSRLGGGLGKNLSGFDPKDLTANSEFGQIDPRRQEAIVTKIQTGEGTVGDLAGIASGEQPVAERPAPKSSLPVDNPMGYRS